MARLHHFCNALPREEYVDTRPVFTFDLLEHTTLRQATVLLPNSLDASLRVFQGKSYWKTERQAKKDAAYVAYVALYRAGLVNDHLMPTVKLPSLPDVEMEKRAPKVMVNATMNPWTIINRSWSTGKLHGCRITITQDDQTYLEMYGVFPEAPPELSKLMLHWDSGTSYEVTFSQPVSFLAYPPFLDLARKANKAILKTIYFSRLSEREDIVCVFVPSLSIVELEKWIQKNTGEIAAKEMSEVSARTLCRNSEFCGSTFLFDSWCNDTISVTGVPRRRNFLQPSSSRRDRHKDVKKLELPVDGTFFNRMPVSYITFALFVPSIMYHMEKELITANLKTQLSGIDDASSFQIAAAITASSASSIQNYQVLEIIGDSVLKFLVSQYLFFKQTKWHEGYLSYIKGNIVSNARLSRVAREMGLDRYIMTDQFSPRKWRPSYIKTVEEDGHGTEADQETDQRSMSTKILADVVESLIGVAFLNGGLPAASTCIASLLSELTDFDNPHAPNEKATDIICPPYFDQIQNLLNYKFNNPSLLISAFTHPSFSSDTAIPSYQRLEFLGDAILDMIVIQRLCADDMPKLGHVEIHLTKEAVVNGNFLAYLCLEQSFETISGMKPIGNDFDVSTTTKQVLLPEMLRMSLQNEKVHEVRSECISRYRALSSQLRQAFTEGTSHPYVLLAQLDAPKFMSDIMESILGAVYVDCGGTIAVCERLCRQWGIIPYLERIVREKVSVVHPKTQLGILAARYTATIAQQNENGKQADMINGDMSKKAKAVAKVRYNISQIVANSQPTDPKPIKSGPTNSQPTDSQPVVPSFGHYTSRTYSCFVSMQDLEFPKIDGARTRHEAITRAALAACEILKDKLQI